MDARQGSSMVALALHLCEHLTFFPEEVELIWSYPWRSRLTSWMFIFTRYSSYLFYLLNLEFAQAVSSIANIQMKGYLSFMFRITTSELMFLVVHFILSKRLTVLYTGVWVRVFVIPGFMIARVSLIFSLGSITYHQMTKKTGRIGSNEVGLLYSGSEAILQLAVLGLMLLAYFTKMGARRNAVTHRLRRREGVGAPIFGLIAMGIGVFMQLQGPPNSLTVYPVYLCAISALGCRLILSNHKVIEALIPTPEYELANSRL